MLVALEIAVRKKMDSWTTERELAATTVELTHSLLLTLLKVNGAKNVGKPLHVPRPWDAVDNKPKLMTMGQFARQSMGAGHG
jgi:hypothetical protein